MRSLFYLLVADGNSDRVLKEIIEMTIRKLDETVRPQGELVDRRLLEMNNARSLSERIRVALRSYSDRLPDILFIHRDAERISLRERLAEVELAVNEAGADQRWVPVIPVRMQEAWLLVDEDAIRAGSGNPNGRIELNLPALSAIESIPDPKAVLWELLLEASERKGRKRKSFHVPAAAQRVVQYMGSVDKLEQLPAFRSFKSGLGEALKEVGR